LALTFPPVGYRTEENTEENKREERKDKKIK
jgi:hypothetical protein